MNEIANSINLEREISLNLKYYRLKLDLDICNKKIEENKQLNKESNFFKNIKVSISNNNRQRKTDKYTEILEIVKRNINEFEHKYGTNYNLCENGLIKGKITSFFLNDKYSLNKTMFGINVILDNEFEYQFKEEEFKEISNLLFDNYDRLTDIYKRLEKHYRNIRGKSLTDLQKNILVGVGIGCAIAFVTCPILVVGGLAASAATTTAALAAIGFSDMQIGVGMVALYSLLTGLALFGSVKLAFDLDNLIEAKKEFRKLNLNEQAIFLSIKALIIEEANNIMPRDLFKDELSTALNAIDALRSDLEYLLFVERNDTETNKEKLKMFNNLNDEFIKIFNV